MSFTEPHLSSKAVSVPGKGVLQHHVTESLQDDPTSFPNAGDDSAGTTRPPGIGNAGGGPGPGAKGSGVAIAQGKVVGSGMVNVGARGEGKSAVDGTSPEFRSSKAQAGNPGVGNKELSVAPGALFPGIHD